MNRAAAPLLLLALAACDPDAEQEDVQDRLSIVVNGGEAAVRMDLDPETLATGVDNSIEIAVEFAAPDDGTTISSDNKKPILKLTQYRIEYTVDDGAELVEAIAGDLEIKLDEDESATAILRAANSEELDFVWQFYAEEEVAVRARVALSGIYDERIGVTVTQEYLATFADYR